MSEQLTMLRVFLASPGGLENEREAIRAVVDEFNKTEAVEEGFYFNLVTWEEMPATRTRPQDKINEGLQRSDYFVLLLWDRWGSPTGDPENRYKSGVEEEFRLAEKCCDDEKHPMEDIAVVFKAPSEAQMRDPGIQLQHVLDFRDELDTNKKIFYKQFDCIHNLESVFRGQLVDWLRARKREAGVDIDCDFVYEISPKPQLYAKALDTDCVAEEQICIARELESLGKLTQAETAYARASSDDDLDALHEYGRFLLRVGRINQAQHKFERMYELAELHGIEEMKSRALADMGVVCRTIGDFKKAMEHFTSALSINAGIDNPEGQANNLGNLGILMRMQGRLEEGRKMLCDAFGMNLRINNKRSMARNLDQIGIIYRVAGDLDIAQEYYEESREINSEIGNEKGLFDNAAHLGSVYRLRGDLTQAEEMYREAIIYNEKYSRKRMLGEVLGNLGTVYRCKGDLEKAEHFYNDSLAMNMAIDCKEGMAKQYAHLAMLAIRREDHDQAESMLMKSIEINMALGLKEGLASNYSSRGTLYVNEQKYGKAKAMFHNALRFNKELNCVPGIADCLGHLGNMYKMEGDVEASVEHYCQSYKLFVKAGMTPNARDVLRCLAAMEVDLSEVCGEMVT